MEKYSRKGSERGLMASKKGYSTSAERGQDGQFCNRIGCSGRLKYSPNTKMGNSDKAKQSQANFCSSNRNEIVRNSTRHSSVNTSVKQLAVDSKRKLPSQFDTSESSHSSESGSSISPPIRTTTSYRSESKKLTVTESGSSSSSLNVRPKKIFHNKSGSDNYQNTQPASSALKSSEHAPFKNNGSRYGLRNLKCNSISDAVTSRCSSSESKSTGKNVMKKRSQVPERNLSQMGRKTTTPLSSGISISDIRRNGSASGEGTSSSGAPVRNQRTMNVNTRMRLSCLQNGRNSSNGVSQSPDIERSSNVGGRVSSRQFAPNLSSTRSSSYSLSSGDGDNPYGTTPFTPPEHGLTNLVNRETLHRYNMDGIAEVLLALETIEQNEELTHEQLLALETSLYLGGLSIYDQHRDMRLDIDNMSYEELLALEERMGTVSTALSEDALSSCIKTETYQPITSQVRLAGSDDNGDDIKCSICQEEYDDGDDIGRLVECRHGYHETCITQWLRLKNWCPVCKSSAAPS